MQLLAGLVVFITAGAISALPSRQPVMTTVSSASGIICDSNKLQCTANLDYEDGEWIAQWKIMAFHTQDSLDVPQEIAIHPVPISLINCDGDIYKCRADLNHGDGRWVAQWATNIFHKGLQFESNKKAPLSVDGTLLCDVDAERCTINMKNYADSRWVAQWAAKISRPNLFVEQYK